jgi:hypothetical protein
MPDADTVVIRRTFAHELTAADLGAQLSGDTADNQAAMWLAFARYVLGWTGRPGMSWPAQCRMICDQLTDEECGDIASVLEPLVDHLRAVPRERAEQRLEAAQKDPDATPF